MSDDLQIVHVRRPGLPWRQEQSRTECGQVIKGDSANVITRDEFFAKIKREGDRRARYSTCQTCLDTAARWPSWDQDPVRCLGREGSVHYGRAVNPQFKNELLALAMLVERHREEFAELLEDVTMVVPLQAGRKGKAQ